MATVPQVERPSAADGRLAGKVAVITGASRGIGLAIARAFASAGCTLVITGRDSHTLESAAESLRRQSGREVLPEVCDVRNAAEVERTFREVQQRFGQLDILVNNAGMSQSSVPVEQTSVELWRDIIDTNLTGTFLCTKFAIPLLPRGATILNIVSVAARDTFPGYTPYNASKAGVLHFTATVREELKPRGIRVSAFLPGATDTEIWQQVMPDAPRERMIEAESIAELALALVNLSPRANLTQLVLDPLAGPM